MYILFQLELHSISISNLNLIGLFSTECSKRDQKSSLESLDIHPIAIGVASISSVLQCVAIGCTSNDTPLISRSLLPHSVEKRPMRFRLEIEIECNSNCNRQLLQCVAVCCSVLQCVAVCCSVLQCVAVCCSVHPMTLR